MERGTFRGIPPSHPLILCNFKPDAKLLFELSEPTQLAALWFCSLVEKH